MKKHKSVVSLTKIQVLILFLPVLFKNLYLIQMGKLVFHCFLMVMFTQYCYVIYRYLFVTLCHRHLTSLHVSLFSSQLDTAAQIISLFMFIISHDEKMILYLFLMHDPHRQISSIYLSHSSSNVLMISLEIIYIGISFIFSVFELCRRGATSASPQQLQGSFSHFCSCWTNNELRTSSNLQPHTSLQHPLFALTARR